MVTYWFGGKRCVKFELFNLFCSSLFINALNLRDEDELRDINYLLTKSGCSRCVCVSHFFRVLRLEAELSADDVIQLGLCLPFPGKPLCVVSYANIHGSGCLVSERHRRGILNTALGSIRRRSQGC